MLAGLNELVMKKVFISALLVALFAVSAVSAKDKKDVVYLLGVSISYSDSTAYFTEIMPIEGVSLVGKAKALPDRQHYAYELKDYMNLQEGMPNRTSVIFFSKKRSKMQKVEAKVKKRLLRGGKDVRYLGDKFKFTRP